MTLAGGLTVGDQIVCRGLPGVVVGGPARAACIRLSVAVRYDDGRIADERVANLELLVEEPDRYENEQEEMPPPQMAQPEYDDARARQLEASQAMWAQPQDAQAPVDERQYADEQQYADERQNLDGRQYADDVASPDSPESPADDQEGPAAQLAPRVVDFGPGTAGYGPDAAEEALRQKIYRNYEDLRAAFRALDRSNNGYVTREDFFQAMGHILLSNGFSEDDVYEVADRFDLNKDGYISYNEFVAVVEGDADQEEQAAEEPALEEDPRLVTAVELAIQKLKTVVDQRYTNIRKAFLAMDTERRSALSPANFAKGMVAHGIFLAPPELELAWSIFDRTGTGAISYTDFCAVMTQRLQFGSHLRRQMFM